MRVYATKRRGLIGLAIVILAISGAGVPAAVLAGPPSLTGVEVTAAVQHDVSAPLSHLGPTSPSSANLRERPLRFTGPGSSPNQPDGAVQAPAATQVATTSGLNFPGVGKGDYGFNVQYSPPDTNGAVGATQYVQWVNTYLAVFDKATGTIAAGFPKAGNAVWSGFGGGCETNNDGDPIVQYDKAANRWILTQFSVSTTPYLQCVAISTSPDATGTYYRYAFNYGSTQFNDYPKLGVWPDGYYVTFNMFTSFFIGPKVCAWDRTKMLAGLAATQQCFQLSSAYGSVLPGDLDGATPPPAGAPNPMLSLGSNSLNLWRFHVDWATPANTTLSGPVNLAVASFSRACNGSNCVPQPNTTQKLDSLGDRLMYRLAYRNFGDHESLVVNHSVSVGGSAVSSVRWYELRNANGSTLANATPVVYQQGTLDTSDGIHRWMGSIAMDASGDIAVGYSASSASLNPSIRYTGRTPIDPLGTMEAESTIQAGSGSQLQNLSRWGDYSAMTVDPVDDCTFWFTSEYLKANGTWNWSTKIASFSFPGCSTTPQPTPTPSPTPTPGPSPTPTPTPTPSPTPTPGPTPTPTPSPTPTPAGNFTITASPQTRSIVHGATTTYTITITPSGGFVGPVSLSASGVPAGATATFNPSSTSSTSTLTVTTASTPAGTYVLTITGTSGSLIHTTSVSLKLR